MRLTTPVNLLKKYHSHIFVNTLKSLPIDKNDNLEINLLDILDNDGVQDCLLAFNCALQAKEIVNKIALSFSIQCAENILHLFEEQYPDDNRPRLAINVCKDIFNNKEILNNKSDFEKIIETYDNVINCCISECRNNVHACSSAVAAYICTKAAIYDYEAIQCAYSIYFSFYCLNSRDKTKIQEQEDILRSLLQDD